MTFQIEAMRREDWRQVRAIYGEGLASGLAAFRALTPLWKEWDREHLAIGRLVARQSDNILGWSALAPVADT